THHVEILCDGQQLAAFGRHPETGNEYEWPKGAPGSIRQSELPLLTKAMAKQLVDAAADIMRRAGWEEKNPSGGPKMARKDRQLRQVKVAIANVNTRRPL